MIVSSNITREQLKEILSNFFEQHGVKYKGEIRIFSTPNRIAINSNIANYIYTRIRCFKLFILIKI